MSFANLPDRVGSLVFCPDCGNLLATPGDHDTVACELCGRVEDAKAQEGVVITTRSHPAAFPSALRQKRALVQHQSSNAETAHEAPIMDEQCPNCKHVGLRYHTLQLRSADEGTTVFYECPICAHKFSTNN